MSDDLNDDQLARITAEDELRRLAYLYDVTSTMFGEPLDVGRRLWRTSSCPTWATGAGSICSRAASSAGR
jgi:hypothetical protein